MTPASEWQAFSGSVHCFRRASATGVKFLDSLSLVFVPPARASRADARTHGARARDCRVSASPGGARVAGGRERARLGDELFLLTLLPRRS